jgi:hypothetical protein
MKTGLTKRLTLALIATLGLSLPAAAQSGPSEGIKVHGRWTIEVRNPDGTIASRHEFDNALSGGESAIAGFLGRFYARVSSWYITLNGTSGICLSGGQPSVACFIHEHVGPGVPAIGELSVNVPMTGTYPQGRVVLDGTVRVAGSGEISLVRTTIVSCQDETCAPGTIQGTQFTSHQLSTPIHVAANQVVQVTVVFSFS